LKTNEEAAFSMEALIQKMNQYPIGKVTAIGYGCAIEQREFQWVQKESKALLWKAIQKAGSSATIEMYDHFIDFCNRHKITNDRDLHKALQQKGILEGKARLAGVLDEKDDALRALYQQLEMQNRLTANALNETALFQQEIIAAESEAEKWKKRAFVAGLFCLIGFGMWAYGLSRKRVMPSSGANLTFDTGSEVKIKALEMHLIAKEDTIQLLKTGFASRMDSLIKNDVKKITELKIQLKEAQEQLKSNQTKDRKINNSNDLKKKIITAWDARRARYDSW
jgi:hypothetical protein